MAVENRTNLKASKDAAFADNSSGGISAGDLRQEIEDLIDSAFLAEDFTGDQQLMTAAEKSKLTSLPAGTAFASTGSGQGASLIGVEDAGAHWSTANVETILDEVGTRFDDLGNMADEDTTSYYTKTSMPVEIALTGGDINFPRPSVPTSNVVIWLQLQPGEEPANKETNDIVPGSQDGVVSVNEQNGTSYTLIASDLGRAVDMTGASNNTVTIPADAAVDYPIGSVININQTGAGTTRIVGDAGVVLNGVPAGGADLNAQFAGVSIRKLAADTWLLQGAHGTVS